jgi:hypothetical protein
LLREALAQLTGIARAIGLDLRVHIPRDRGHHSTLMAGSVPL